MINNLKWIENYFSDQELNKLFKIRRAYKRELEILENVIKRKEYEKRWEK